MTDERLIEVVGFYHDRELKWVTAESLVEEQFDEKEIHFQRMRQHLKWMCREILQGRVTGTKAHRWLGYVQGELRGMEAYSINELREHSRGEEQT